MKLKEIELSKHTRLKVGGKARLFCAENMGELITVVKNYEFYLMGSGSYILAGDKIDRIILKQGRNFEKISYLNGKITVGAPVLKSTLAKFALQNEIGGFEFFAALPGTVGSAIKMGTYASILSDLLDSATFVDENGEVLTLSSKEIGFTSGGNSLPDHYVCVEAIFNAEHSVPKEEIKLLTLEILRKRHEFHPSSSEAVCEIFRDPPGLSACELVEKAGFKGFSLENAKISEKNCNFLVNAGCKVAEPLIEVCYIVRNGVREKLGVTLEFAVVFI